MISTGLEIAPQPAARVNAPKDQGLKYREEHGGELGTPNASRAIVVFSPVNRRPDGVLAQVVIHGGLRMLDKHREPRPMREQAR